MTESQEGGSEARAPIRVLLVDDHVFWRRGVREIVDSEPDMEVIAEAEDGAMAVRKAGSLKPDVVLMDVNMPVMSGVAATAEVSAASPESRILMLTVSDTDENLFNSLKAGAIGFLTKDAHPDDLIRAIRSTAAGESSLPPAIAARVVRFIQQGAPQAEAPPMANLTDREEEILRLIAQGARDREIADTLFISESTVKKHVQNVLRKLHARNRVEAVSHLNRGAGPQL